MDGANVEIVEEVGAENAFIFGLSSDEVINYENNGGYNPMDIYNSDADIRRVVNQLVDGTYSQGDKEMYRDLYNSLLTAQGGSKADTYFILKDFRSYAEGENILFNRLSLGNHDLKIRLAGHEETATTWQISVRPSILFYLETLLFILLLLATWQFHVLKTKRMRIKQAFSRKYQMDMAIAASRAIRMQKERDEQKKKEYEEARATGFVPKIQNEPQ